MFANSSHFPSKYAHLNNPSLYIRLSRLRVARCLMMVGCGGWGEFGKRGLFRLTYLGSLALSSTEKSNHGISLATSFWNLDMSEQIPTSYHIGMGVTKAFSEDCLSIPWLSHISSYKNRIIWNGPTAAAKVSLHSPPAGKKAKEPDLIGYDFNGNPHILESKGYSSGFKGSALQHAINQVSQVSSVSGVNPETRVAVFNDLSKNPFQARIVDPEGPEMEGCSIEWPLSQCIKDYYSVFLENQEDSIFFEINNQPYIGFDLIYPGIRIGLNKKLFDYLLQPKTKYVEVLNIKNELLENSLETETQSIGIDGVALIYMQNTFSKNLLS